MKAIAKISLVLGLSASCGYAWTLPAQEEPARVAGQTLAASAARGGPAKGRAVKSVPVPVVGTKRLPLFEEEEVKRLLSKLLAAQVEADAGKEGAAVAAQHWKQKFEKAFWAEVVSLAADPELRAQQAIFVANNSDFFDIAPEAQEGLWRELFFTPGVESRSKKILRGLLEDRGLDPFGSRGFQPAALEK